MGAFTIVPGYVLGGAGQAPSSEKLNIPCVGAGGRARDNIDSLKSENVAALCDVDDKRAAQTYKAYPQARRYRDFRKMLEKERNIDAVVVSTPDHTHAVASMMAIKLGKHVYCEKPLAHSIYEVRKIIETAKAAGVATQMGNQRHALEGIRLVCEWIWDGASTVRAGFCSDGNAPSKPQEELTPAWHPDHRRLSRPDDAVPACIWKISDNSCIKKGLNTSYLRVFR